MKNKNLYWTKTKQPFTEFFCLEVKKENIYLLIKYKVMHFIRCRDLSSSKVL